MNRRTLLRATPLLAGGAVVGLASIRDSTASAEVIAPPPPPVLSSAVLGAVHVQCLTAAVKAGQGTLVQNDVTSTVTMVNLLQAHFSEVGFDASFKAMCAQFGAPPVSVAGSTLASNAFSTLSAAGSTLSLYQIESAFSRLMPSDQIPSQFAQLQANGLTPTLTSISTMLTKTARAMDDEGGDDGGDDGGLGEGDGGDGTGSGSSFCDNLNFVSAAIGTAAAELSLGCLPVDPAFVIICPAVLVLGIIAALIAIIAWIAC